MTYVQIMRNIYVSESDDKIGEMLGAAQEILGRVNQLFVPGQGLSPAGVKMLGAKLANMTIGDLEAMLDMQNLDPVLVVQLMKNLKDLLRALASLTIFVGSSPFHFICQQFIAKLCKALSIMRH